MNVFLVWSGTPTLELAHEFRDWLPLILPAAKPFMSDDDIRKGQLWRTKIGSQLGNTNFGVVFVSAANQHAPWLNFEAGALAKHVDSASVAPILLDLMDSDLDGPLRDFHTTKPNREDIFKLVQSINDAAKEESEHRDERQVEHIFDKVWSDFAKSLTHAQDALNSEPTSDIEQARSPDQVLDEILILSRQHSRMIANLAAASTPVRLGGGVPIVMTDVNQRAAFEANQILGEKYHGTLPDFPSCTIWLKEGASIHTDERQRIRYVLSLLGFTNIWIHPEPPSESVDATLEST